MSREEVRKRIDQAAASIRAEREAGRGLWARLRAWLSGVDAEAEREAERKRREHAEARARSNRAFRLDDSDFLPGGRAEQLRRAGTLGEYRRRDSRSGYLDRGSSMSRDVREAIKSLTERN